MNIKYRDRKMAEIGLQDAAHELQLLLRPKGGLWGRLGNRRIKLSLQGRLIDRQGCPLECKFCYR